MESTSSPREPLLSDEDFADLMTAEHQRDGAAVDELAKERVWRKLQVASQSRAAPTIMRREWLGAAAAAIGFILLLPLVVMQWPANDELRMKGTLPGMVDVRLSSYVLSDNGKLTPVPTPARVGTTVVFKVDLSQQAAVALVLARNNESPVVRFAAELAAGAELPLARDSAAYGYTIETTDASLRFCLLGAENRALLDEQLKKLPAVWSTLASTQCVAVHTQ